MCSWASWAPLGAPPSLWARTWKPVAGSKGDGRWRGLWPVAAAQSPLAPVSPSRRLSERRLSCAEASAPWYAGPLVPWSLARTLPLDHPFWDAAWAAGARRFLCSAGGEGAAPSDARGAGNRLPTSSDSRRSDASNGSPAAPEPFRVIILGAGFAGLSVAWHLLQMASARRPVCVVLVDQQGVGAGASGISGGLLHPYSPKGRLLWRGREAWASAVRLLHVAEAQAEVEAEAYAKQEAEREWPAKKGQEAREMQTQEVQEALKGLGGREMGREGPLGPAGESRGAARLAEGEEWVAKQFAWRRGGLRLPLNERHSKDFEQSGALPLRDRSAAPRSRGTSAPCSSGPQAAPPPSAKDGPAPGSDTPPTASPSGLAAPAKARAASRPSSTASRAARDVSQGPHEPLNNGPCSEPGSDPGPGAEAGAVPDPALVVPASFAAALVPGVVPPVSSSALYVPCAITLNPRAYLQALWAACKRHAARVSSSTSPGTQAMLLRRHVESLEIACRGVSLGTPGTQFPSPDAVVVCMGAEAFRLPDLPREDLPPISLSRGHVLTIQAPPDGKYPEGAPSLLGSTWLAVRGTGEALVGATSDSDCGDFFAPPSEAEDQAARDTLLSAAQGLLPHLAHWRVTGIGCGVRALSRRSKYGKLPVALRLRPKACHAGATPERSGSMAPPSRSDPGHVPMRPARQRAAVSYPTSAGVPACPSEQAMAAHERPMPLSSEQTEGLQLEGKRQGNGPSVGDIPEKGGAPQEQRCDLEDDWWGSEEQPALWFFGALGSRGLVYHAWLGEAVARAVLAEDETLIPEEFRPRRHGQAKGQRKG